MSTRAIITGIAMLLATGAAHAYDEYSAPLNKDRFGGNGANRPPDIDADFNCDRLPKFYHGGHLSQEHTTKDVTLNFKVGSPTTGKGSYLGKRLSFGTI